MGSSSFYYESRSPKSPRKFTYDYDGDTVSGAQHQQHQQQLHGSPVVPPRSPKITYSNGDCGGGDFYEMASCGGSSSGGSYETAHRSPQLMVSKKFVFDAVSPRSESLNSPTQQQQQQQHFQQHHHQQQQHPHHHHQSNQQLNASISGPPTMGLFDSLKTLDTTSTSGQFGAARGNAQVQQSGGVAAGTSAVNFSFNQSYGVGGGFNESSINEAYLTQSDFNVSRLTSPHQHLQQAGGAAAAAISGSDFLRTPSTTTHAIGYDAGLLSPRQATAPFWVTVFGFPPAAVNAILSHFAQCGTIVDKMLPPNGGGNWMHLKYASRVECDKAVNFNERIIGNCMMIGVVYCRDADIVDKENNGGGVGATDLQQQRTGSNR